MFALGLSLTGFIAWIAFNHAVANIVWQRNPDMALRFVPDHPLALSRKADELFEQKQDPATLAKVEAMAKQSLRGGALNPVAIRLLGYVADVRGDQNKARELMLLSHKVSRRDFGTQLWLIEDAVARNDKRKALYHYDIALRTTPASFPLLFPTLSSALADPEVRTLLAPYFKATPNWLAAFLGDALGSRDNPANIAETIMKAGGLPDDETYVEISNRLLTTLAGKSNFASFRQYYLSLPKASPATLESAGLNPATVNLRFRPAGWQLAESSAIGGSFAPFDGNRRTSLLAYASSGERGVLMQKYLFLKPGNYRFSASYEAQATAPDSEIRWELQCLSTNIGPPKWVTNSTARKGASTDVQEFSLGSDCPYQNLVLNLAGGSSQLGAEFTLRSVEIIRR